MHGTYRAFARLAGVALMLLPAIGAAPLEAAPAPAIWQGWPVLDADEDGDCRLEILGNGKFMLIRATGLGPAEQGHFIVTNATMKPVDWPIISDAQGVFARAFLPNLWSNADGTIRDARHEGRVAVSISTQRCSLSASAPWRNEIRVID